MLHSVPRWFTRPQTVTHPSTNRAQCRLTSLIKPTPPTTGPLYYIPVVWDGVIGKHDVGKSKLQLVKSTLETLENMLEGLDARRVVACCATLGRTSSASYATVTPTASPGKPCDCANIINNGDSHGNGKYTVYIGHQRAPVEVYCDMTLSLIHI